MWVSGALRISNRSTILAQGADRIERAAQVMVAGAVAHLAATTEPDVAATPTTGRRRWEL